MLAHVGRSLVIKSDAKHRGSDHAHHDAGEVQLVDESIGHRSGGGRHQDAVVWRLRRPPEHTWFGDLDPCL